MAKHMQAPAWDQLIKHIDTVERVDDTLYVYFTLYVPPTATACVFIRNGKSGITATAPEKTPKFARIGSRKRCASAHSPSRPADRPFQAHRILRVQPPLERGPQLIRISLPTVTLFTPCAYTTHYCLSFILATSRCARAWLLGGFSPDAITCSYIQKI